MSYRSNVWSLVRVWESLYATKEDRFKTTQHPIFLFKDFYVGQKLKSSYIPHLNSCWLNMIFFILYTSSKQKKYDAPNIMEQIIFKHLCSKNRFKVTSMSFPLKWFNYIYMLTSDKVAVFRV